jgi:alpha-glucosidase (family GH31 glycosyl hydrolase)
VIRHRPFGSEHPYLITQDQRDPSRPLIGEQIRLGVLASAAVTHIRCEWQVDGGSVELHLRRDEPEMKPPATGTSGDSSTHLAAAASRSGGSGTAWCTIAPGLEHGQRVRYRFHSVTADGRTATSKWFSVSAASWSTDSVGLLQITGVDRLVPGSVTWLSDADQQLRVRFALRLDPEEHVIGFGERFDRTDQRGHALDSVVFEQYKGQGSAGRTYLPMPFAIVAGGAGWGFHVRTSRRSWFDVGATEPDRLWVEVDLGGDKQLELICYDGDPASVLGQFLDEVGRPEILPDWVFRLWSSGNEWNTQARVLSELDRHAAEDIPVGCVVIEAWSDESTFAAFRDARYPVHPDGGPHRLAEFEFPTDGAWPDPQAMVRELHDRDVRVLLWQIPLQKMRPHPTGQAAADARVMLERGYGVREADGRPYRNRGWWFPLALMPDLTNDEGKAWWLAKRRYLVEEIGIDGFKTDGGEHAWGHDLNYADGHRGDDGNNLYPVHYAAAYGELLRACGKAPVTFSRAGFTGSQQHGVFWAGDEDSTWEAFRHSVTAGITASASGIVYWGWDIAGFSGDVPSAELYLRASAMACFAPIVQYHSEFNHHRTPSRDRTPWNIAERSGDPRVVPTFRAFAQLRERLVPYLSEQVVASLAAGKPLMRALAFDYPDDDRIWAHPYQYMLGDALLIAPVVNEGSSTWHAYLPAGDWVDMWTGNEISGGQVVEVEAPLDRIPVWSRRQSWPELQSVFALK